MAQLIGHYIGVSRAGPEFNQVVEDEGHGSVSVRALRHGLREGGESDGTRKSSGRKRQRGAIHDFGPRNGLPKDLIWRIDIYAANFEVCGSGGMAGQLIRYSRRRFQ